MSNQIINSFVALGTFPNFTRDRFGSLTEMYNATNIDDGHISFCADEGIHYVCFLRDSNNNILTGKDRWIPLAKVNGLRGLKELAANLTYIVDEEDELKNETLAEELGLGRVVFVKNTDKLYYNTYGGGQAAVYDAKNNGWFRELLTKEDYDNAIVSLGSQIEDKVSIGTFDSTVSVINNTLADKVSTGTFVAAVSNINNTLADKVSIGTFDKTVNEIYGKINNITGGDYEEISNIAKSALNAAGAAQNNLDNYKNEVEGKYATLENLDNYVKDTTFQDEMAATVVRIQKLETNIKTKADEEDLITLGSAFESYKIEADSAFESYKIEADSKYAKPGEISSLLNNYAPDQKYKDIWVGNENLGNLAGQTGAEIAQKHYSYNDVFDQICFDEYIPKYTLPSVNVSIKENWNNGLSIDWYDKENRIILVKAGSVGPDGSDFNAVNPIDGMISYPSNLNLGSNLTNGLTDSDLQQKSTGFCKIKDENGNWKYYEQDGTIYHVPSKLEPGEYRYHMVAYFNEGSPVLTNYNQKIYEWKDIWPVESEDYITIIASKPTFYNTKDGFVENPLVLWTDNICDYMTLKPSCQLDQSFKTPRKLKSLGIWNDIAGDYAVVPMVYQKDEKGNATTNLVPSYFEEIVDEDGYYTYIYNSKENGHRGAIKIKVTF